MKNLAKLLIQKAKVTFITLTPEQLKIHEELHRRFLDLQNKTNQ